jgi:hypothetical protein
MNDRLKAMQDSSSQQIEEQKLQTKIEAINAVSKESRERKV